MRGRVAGAALTMSVLVLAGCSGEAADQPLESVPSQSSPAPSSSSPVTSEPAPTTSATPTGAPVLPPEAAEQTPDGAAAFVQHWFDTLEYSWEVMESTHVRQLGECLTCIQFADTIDEVKARGNRLEGAETTVSSISPNAVLADGSGGAVALFSATEQREVDPAGELVSVIDPGVEGLQYLFTLGWRSDSWTVMSVNPIR